jgi:hypothetical protein
VFVLGQDGFVRTLWMNPQESFPSHPWSLNPGRPARRGSPFAAACRALDQIDLFYVSADHHLTTQWWNPLSLDWSNNRRALPEPLVAGGSNIVALAGPADATNPGGSLDVFYIGLSYMTPYADPAWKDGWQVVHAAWPVAGDWNVTPIPGMDEPAASTGAAAARDPQSALHVVVQTRDRAALRHAIREPGRAWQVDSGPAPLGADVERRNWWMSLYLAVLPDFLLLVGMTSAGTLAWATYAAGRWSTTAYGQVTFATSRPLALGLLGTTRLDLAGWTKMGPS